MPHTCGTALYSIVILLYVPASVQAETVQKDVGAKLLALFTWSVSIAVLSRFCVDWFATALSAFGAIISLFASILLMVRCLQLCTCVCVCIVGLSVCAGTVCLCNHHWNVLIPVYTE